MAFGQLSVKGRALKLLAAREHSRQELERKLAAKEPDPAEVKQALDELQARGFLDEQRVVDSIVHRRAGRMGVGRIRQELQAKGIDAERVALAVASLHASEFERGARGCGARSSARCRRMQRSGRSRRASWPRAGSAGRWSGAS
jgi:regulatory protein